MVSITAFRAILMEFWEKCSQFFLAGRRLALGCIFVLGLAFFFHYREVKVEHLDLGEVATKYILAQVSFEVPDTEAMKLLKQEAVRDIGPIYHFDERDIAIADQEINHRLDAHQEWRRELPHVTFEELYLRKQAIKETLSKLYFVDERTFRKLDELGVSRNNYVILGKDLWESVGRVMFIDSTPLDHYLLENFRQVATQPLRQDFAKQTQIRHLSKAKTPLKLAYVEAGSRIINAGEKVTARHVEMLKAMKEKLVQQRNYITPLTIIGSIGLALIFTVIFTLYLKLQYLSLFRTFRKLALLVTIVMLTLAFAKVTEYLIMNKAGHLAEAVRYPIFILFGTLLSSVLLGSQIALMLSGFLAAILGVTSAIGFDRFIVINVGSSLVALLFARHIRRRKEIFEVCAKVWIAIVPLIIACNFFENNWLSQQLLYDLAVTFICILVIAVSVAGLLPALESMFSIVTDMALMEYVDPNHPLLRRLSLETPGTYQHSLAVGVLAESAAQAIGSNGLFCRVATLYHDVGKLANPQYFTENQGGALNVHKLLTPIESVQVILAHVPDGVAFAQQYKLPRSFIAIIREHHGTSVVYPFYRAQVDLMGDPSLVDISLFRYDGPKPRSKESAIIMIGDMVEAAFRSLTDVNERSVEELVETLVAQRLHEGQFDECRLTFEELGLIKKTMAKTLLMISHARVKYPSVDLSTAPVLA